MKTKDLFTYDVRPGYLFRIPKCPDNVMFDLTWQCNYRCAFCYNPDANRKLQNPPWEVTEAILRGLADWGVREVLYLGGEPTLHPRFDAVIELGAELGLSQRMVTNASRITRPRARLLAGCDVEVGVSLHSARPGINNRLTGAADSFQHAIDALNLLIDLGVRCFVQYSPTRLDPGGLTELAEFLRDRYGRQIAFIDVNRILPFGEATDDKAQVVHNADGWWNVLRSVGELVLSGWEIRVESVPHCWVRQRANTEGLSNNIVKSILSSLRPCYMGITQLAINTIGKIKACPGIEANIPAASLSPNAWREHPALVARRNLLFLPENCVDYGSSLVCSDFYSCLGGCRSASGSQTGDHDPLSVSKGTTGRPL
jgi:MoaA/NifB/PqqE/SkfB family radical SAM enzyme